MVHFLSSSWWCRWCPCHSHCSGCAQWWHGGGGDGAGAVGSGDGVGTVGATPAVVVVVQSQINKMGR